MLSGLCRRSLPLCRNVSVVRRLPSSRKFSTVEPTETDFAKAIQALHIINGPVSGEKLKYEKKHKFLNENPDLKRHDMDCGSPEAQITLWTGRIKYLQDHLALNPKDNYTKRRFLMLLGNRQKMLTYLRRKDPEKHLEVTSRLEIRVRNNLDSQKSNKRSVNQKKKDAKLKKKNKKKLMKRKK